MQLRWFPGSRCVSVAPGERLLDVIDEHAELQLPVACRAANCGTCLVRVLAGGAGIAPPSDWEREVLERVGAAADQRLGCQLCFEDDTAGAPSEPLEVVLERC